MSWIIVKYAEMLYPEKIAPKSMGIGDSFSARMCKINRLEYASKTDAENDLDLLNNFNPTANYGIVEAIEE